MKTSKRIISSLLCLIMVIGALTICGGFCGLSELIETKASASSYSVGDIIEFGSYPQSRVTDSETISALNELAGDNSTWTSYGYYSGSGSWYNGEMTSSDYMRYKDVSYNGDRYRAVTFDAYRPCYTGNTSSASNTYQDDNGYKPGSVYWFRYEPIEWRVLDPSSGMVMCNTVIDSQAYSNYILKSGSEYYCDSGCTYYATNYAKSSIRQWLNNEFYNTAFTDKQKENILKTTLDSSSPDDSEYDAPSTTDKVFLLSYADLINSSYGFSSYDSDYDTSKKLKSTDYAESQGCWEGSENGYTDNSWWWLRSPYNSNYVHIIGYDGIGNYYDNVCGTHVGVVPALCLQNLESDTSFNVISPAEDNTENYTTGKNTKPDSDDDTDESAFDTDDYESSGTANDSENNMALLILIPVVLLIIIITVVIILLIRKPEKAGPAKAETLDYGFAPAQNFGASARSSFKVIPLNRAGVCSNCGNAVPELFSITVATAAGNKPVNLCSECTGKFAQDYSIGTY